MSAKFFRRSESFAERELARSAVDGGLREDLKPNGKHARQVLALSRVSWSVDVELMSPAAIEEPIHSSQNVLHLPLTF